MPLGLVNENEYLVMNVELEPCIHEKYNCIVNSGTTIKIVQTDNIKYVILLAT